MTEGNGSGSSTTSSLSRCTDFGGGVGFLKLMPIPPGGDREVVSTAADGIVIFTSTW